MKTKLLYLTAPPSFRLAKFYFLLLFLLPLGSGLLLCQAPNWQWAKSAGGTSNDFGRSVSTDASGNVLVTGYFSSATLTFGTTTIINAGLADIFIVKYDPNGNVLWATSAGGTGSEGGTGLAIDSSGNALVTGYYQSNTITFGTTTLTNTDSIGITSDVFLVRYDVNGNALWAKSAGGTSEDVGCAISTDANGNVLVTGYFGSDSLSFGNTVLTNDTTNNTYDIFVAKLNSSVMTSVPQNYFGNTISIFPNPSSGNFTIQFNASESGNGKSDSYGISLINLLGEQVYSAQKEITSGAQFSIDVALPASMGQGVYFLKLTTDNKNYYQKIVIEK